MADNPPVDGMRALLSADDGERRAIERTLHDGVQQQLVGVAVALQAGLRLFGTDPAAAVDLIEDARAAAHLALDELQAVARRVYPPLLDTQGLDAALRMAAAAASIPTHVEGTADGPLPPEVAVTVYRCCVCALTAAAGDRASATVTVRRGEDMLEFEVALRGASLDPQPFEPLAVRAGILGGALEVAPEQVGGRLPLTLTADLRRGT